MTKFKSKINFKLKFDDDDGHGISIAFNSDCFEQLIDNETARSKPYLKQIKYGYENELHDLFEKYFTDEDFTTTSWFNPVNQSRHLIIDHALHYKNSCFKDEAE